MVEVECKVNIDFSKLEHIKKINEKREFLCRLNWEIVKDNSIILFKVIFSKNEIEIFNQLNYAFHYHVGSFREVIQFSEISQIDIENIVIDEPVSTETRAQSDKIGFCEYTFEFNYLEIQWKSGYNKECVANLYLSDNALRFFRREFYSHSVNKEDKNPQNVELHFKYKPNLNYISFGQVEFLPFLNVYDVQFLDKISSFQYEPLIKVKFDNNIEPDALKNYFDIICGLFSLYNCTYFDYVKIEIILENRIVDVYHKSKSNNYFLHASFPYYLKFDKPNIFIQSFNTQNLLNNVQLFRKTINNYLLSVASTSETKFMFLYVIIENLKDEVLKKDKNVYFNFSSTKSERDESLDRIGEELSSFVIDEEKCEFIEKYQDFKRDVFIRRMKKQLALFFIQNCIDVKQEYNFDFDDAVKIRNSIFHGLQLTQTDYKTLNVLLGYDKLPKLVEDLIFSFFGAKPHEVRYKNWKNVKK